MKDKIVDRIFRFFSVKSLVTFAMTIFLGCLLSGAWQPLDGIVNLYCTAYGAIITYFFTRKEGDSK